MLGRYKELVDQADLEAVTGTDARALSHKHLAEFKEQDKAFNLHRDNHYALWLEAKEYVHAHCLPNVRVSDLHQTLQFITLPCAASSGALRRSERGLRDLAQPFACIALWLPHGSDSECVQARQPGIHQRHRCRGEDARDDPPLHPCRLRPQGC